MHIQPLARLHVVHANFPDPTELHRIEWAWLVARLEVVQTAEPVVVGDADGQACSEHSLAVGASHLQELDIQY